MKITQQQLKKIVREELEKEQLTEQQLQELFDGIKAGLQAGKQEFAYRRALKNIQGVLNKSVLPTFDKMLKTYQQLSKEQYDFPQVNSQFKKTLDTILKELDSVVAALPDDESQNLKTNLATKKQELETASAALKALPKADKDAAAAAEKAKAGTQSQAVAAPVASQAAAKRDDKQQVDEVFGDIKKAFQQGALARKSANYVQALRKMVDTVKPALLNLRKLSPVLKAQKQAVEDPIAIKKAQDAKAAEPEALPSAGSDFNATALKTATPADTAPTTSATPPPAQGTQDTAAAPAAGEVSTSTGIPTSGETSASSTPPEATVSPPLQPDQETTAAPTSPAAAGEKITGPGAVTPSVAAASGASDINQLRSLAPPAPKTTDQRKLDNMKATLEQQPNNKKLRDDIKALEKKIGRTTTFGADAIKEGESKKSVSYNKLYENWKRFTKG